MKYKKHGIVLISIILAVNSLYALRDPTRPPDYLGSHAKSPYGSLF